MSLKNKSIVYALLIGVALVSSGIYFENGYIFILGMIFSFAFTFNIVIFVEKNEKKLSRLLLCAIFGLISGFIPH